MQDKSSEQPATLRADAARYALTEQGRAVLAAWKENRTVVGRGRHCRR